MGRIIIAAASSGSGKTLITCGLIKCLVDRKLSVQAYKCGPDYIDPMFHKKVLGIPSENLDTFFCDEYNIGRLLSYGNDKDVSVIEGVMGIYDGVGGVHSEGSAYDLAVKTKTPIVLIVNARGMGRTLVSIVKGILADDKESLIKGVILNNISKGYYDSIAPILEDEAGIRVLGFLPKLSGINIESRHLGLKLPSEIEDLNVQITNVAEAMGQNINIDDIIRISGQVGTIYDSKEYEDFSKSTSLKGKKVSIAKDEVFCFIYDDNLRMLENSGANIEFFSPLHDSAIPDDTSILVLPGGYPELRLPELSANKSMRNSIKTAVDKGMPIFAECGGFMYLHNSIQGDDGKEYEMVGAIDGKCYNTGKLCRFGYVNVQAGDYTLKGHEFHYYDSTANGSDFTAVKASTNKEYRFGYNINGGICGFPHLYWGQSSVMESE